MKKVLIPFLLVIWIAVSGVAVANLIPQKNDNSNNNDENNNYHKNLNIVNQLIFDKTFINKISKNLLALFLTIFIFISIGFILWNIPYTKNYFINLYNTNSSLKFLVNLFIT